MVRFEFPQSPDESPGGARAHPMVSTVESSSLYVETIGAASVKALDRGKTTRQGCAPGWTVRLTSRPRAWLEAVSWI